MEGKIKLEPRSKRSKNQSWKVSRNKYMNMMSERLILDFYKLPAFQKLSAYYMQSTVFNVLGVERSENRQSAFLAWLLNPKSSHGLNDSARTFLWMPAL